MATDTEICEMVYCTSFRIITDKRIYYGLSYYRAKMFYKSL